MSKLNDNDNDYYWSRYDFSRELKGEDGWMDNLFDCDCGMTDQKSERGICKRCERIMCSFCKEDHRKKRDVCFKDEWFKTRKEFVIDPVGDEMKLAYTGEKYTEDRSPK